MSPRWFWTPSRISSDVTSKRNRPGDAAGDEVDVDGAAPRHRGEEQFDRGEVGRLLGVEAQRAPSLVGGEVAAVLETGQRHAAVAKARSAGLGLFRAKLHQAPAFLVDGADDAQVAPGGDPPGPGAPGGCW